MIIILDKIVILPNERKLFNKTDWITQVKIHGKNPHLNINEDFPVVT